jgi:hypothetical protein
MGFPPPRLFSTKPFLHIMKNLRIVESCLLNGKHVEAGTKLENVDNAVAADLVSSGRAAENRQAQGRGTR